MNGLSWPAILRLGLVQTALGAIVVLTTSTINRVMVVELALPAMLPGVLVALHHFVQMSRPRFGYGADVGGRSTPWIIGGMLVLAAGGVLAAVATALMVDSTALGTAVAFIAFMMIGLGVGAAGTSLLALLAKRVAPARRPAAATIVWIMMIMGFALTAGIAGHFLDPFSPTRLIAVSSTVSLLAVLLTVVSLWGLEGRAPAPPLEATAASAPNADNDAVPRFKQALKEIWQEAEARQFTVFVFVSMVAYSAQDLILEPYAGAVFGMTPGESTQLAGVQHGGVLLGMLMVAVSGALLRRASGELLRFWTIGGCVASALALLGIASGGALVEHWPLTANVFVLGVANGAFAVGAIASMMTLAGQGKARREGLRMGLWGAAQAIAFAVGGFLGTMAVDVMRLFAAEPVTAYAAVFTAEAALFLVAAILGVAIRPTRDTDVRGNKISFGAVAAREIFQGR